MTEKTLFTLEEAAEYLNRPLATIADAYYKGRLQGEAVGKAMKLVVVGKPALDEFASKYPGKRGRPRKSTP